MFKVASWASHTHTHAPTGGSGVVFSSPTEEQCENRHPEAGRRDETFCAAKRREQNEDQ